MYRYVSYNIDLNGTKSPKNEDHKYMTIKHYLKLIEYFKSRNEQSYIFLYLMAITGARYSDLINMTRRI
ncbi:integrase [Mammaliicoccus lentus]